MQVRLIELKQRDKIIGTIKAVRHASTPMLGLKESKDLVDRMRDDVSYKPVLEIADEPGWTLRELDQYFTFEQLNKLKLYEVVAASPPSLKSQYFLVLAIDKGCAMEVVAPLAVIRVNTLVGPFKNGTILASGTQMNVNKELSKENI